ncbi:DUF397 domain-containing protein [Sphaerisporangium aureirubrum]|uniref:DUF397 domain-containing protein n=1 Tax=Sphaerisporangium aureirubrum TaxID=1544736 RepID=A0ABW1NES6_9ACTN
MERDERCLDLPDSEWRRSSWSGVEGGNCVEVTSKPTGVAGVRDSKSPARRAVAVSAHGWSSFLEWLKAEGARL